MKRFITLGILAQFCFGICCAQNEKAVKASTDTIRTSKVIEISKGLSADGVSQINAYRNKYYWFADIAVGGGFYNGELNRNYNNYLSRMKPSVQLSVGKWIYPQWAVRFALGYTKFTGCYYLYSNWNMYDQGAHNEVPAEALKDYYADEQGVYWFHRKFEVADAQFDVIYDVNRLFTTRKTPFDINLSAGIGYAYAFKSQGASANSSVAFKLGLETSVNVTKKIYVKGAVEGTLCDESLDGQIGGHSVKSNFTLEGYCQCMVGVGFRWGFTKKRVKTYSLPYTVTNQKKYTTKEKIVKTDLIAPFVVRFYIDQYNVEPDQELKIAEACTYLQKHPNARLLMTGHCDPETATPEYNQKLSERRCESVLKYIDDHYNIDHSRIDVKPMGDTQSKFKQDYRWNRCVILTIIEK